MARITVNMKNANQARRSFRTYTQRKEKDGRHKNTPNYAAQPRCTIGDGERTAQYAMHASSKVTGSATIDNANSTSDLSRMTNIWIKKTQINNGQSFRNMTKV